MGLQYYADMNDAPVTDMLRQASIKIENNLMVFSDSSWQDCPDTGINKGAYIIFYQGVFPSELLSQCDLFILVLP